MRTAEKRADRHRVLALAGVAQDRHGHKDVPWGRERRRGGEDATAVAERVRFARCGPELSRARLVPRHRDDGPRALLERGVADLVDVDRRLDRILRRRWKFYKLCTALPHLQNFVVRPSVFIILASLELIPSRR